MKCLTRALILATISICSAQVNAATPEAASKAAAASSCNLMYRNIAAKLCTDWHGKHGLAALYDLLPTRTPAQRAFKESIPAQYEKNFGRPPEKMPLALPRFERMKNNFRTVQERFAKLQSRCGAPGCPPCPTVPPEEETGEERIEPEMSTKIQQLNDSISIAINDIAHLSTQLSQKKTPDKNLAASISALSKQLQMVTSLLGQQRGMTTKVEEFRSARQDQLDELRQNCENEKNRLQTEYKEKINSLTSKLVSTSKQLSEAVSKRGAPTISEEDLERATMQLHQVTEELATQKNQTAREQQYAQQTLKNLDALKSALYEYVGSERQLMVAYNNHRDIYVSVVDYAPESVQSLIDIIKEKWDAYIQSISNLDSALYAVGMGDLQIEPNDCYDLMIKGALMGYESNEVEE